MSQCAADFQLDREQAVLVVIDVQERLIPAMKTKVYEKVRSNIALLLDGAKQLGIPGEAILGWNIVRQLGRFHDVTVLTRSYNREALERGLKERGLEADCRYVTLPRAFSPLLKHYLGFSLYYLFWQMKAFGMARRDAGAFNQLALAFASRSQIARNIEG